MAISQALLPEFQHEMAGLRRMFERIPQDRWDFRPHPKSFTLGDLANHLANIPGWLLDILQKTELDLGLPETQAAFPKPCTSLDALLKRLDAHVETALEALPKASDEDFHVIWTLKDQGKAVLAMPRVAVYRGFVMNHMIHHRAQLTVYFRLMGVPLPALYGPSADEA